MASFSELVLTAVHAASHQVSEGSRRNARLALEARQESLRESGELLAALPAQRPAAAGTRRRRSA